MRVRHITALWGLIVLALACACAGCQPPPAIVTVPAAPAPLVQPVVPVSPQPILLPVPPAPVVVPLRPWLRPVIVPQPVVRPVCPRCPHGAAGRGGAWWPGKAVVRVVRAPFRPAPPKNPIRPQRWPAPKAAGA